MNKKVMLAGIAILIILSALFILYSPKTIIDSGRESSPKMSSPVLGTLSLSDKPLLNVPVKLTLSVKSL